mmetsp:Transcript_111051/g.254598  ORF Transcript_111051/g.254598 Transcript_111051/m.254598 type:complete len:362 (+) Transcript_111051:2523-3608(+)
MLSDLACVSTRKSCATRSELRCLDVKSRLQIPCPYPDAIRRSDFVACGEHAVCELATNEAQEDWCVSSDMRLPDPVVPWVSQLTHDDEGRVCSQCGQDGVIRAIFRVIGFRSAASVESPPYFVEFGARKPEMLNSAVLRKVCGWNGLLMDFQPGESPHGGCAGCPGLNVVENEFITAENVNSVFLKYLVPVDFELLTIDTDFNDYWIWRALLVNGTFRPRVVAVDFNPDLDMHVTWTVPYSPTAEWDGTRYTVASLLAYQQLGSAFGYEYAYSLEMGAHAFFIRRDLLHPEDYDLPLRLVQKESHLEDRDRRPFVDVSLHDPALQRTRVHVREVRQILTSALDQLRLLDEESGRVEVRGHS